MNSWIRISAAFAFSSLVSAAPAFAAQVVLVKDEQLISTARGGFGGTLAPGDFFGSAVASPGDLDGDGIDDLAVGSPGDDEGGSARGAVWILFMNADGTVRAEQKISAPPGLDAYFLFGTSLAPLGDFDHDGVGDLAVGARSAVWLLFLDADGTVKSELEISATAGGFGGAILPSDRFGCSVTCPGDLDGDGTPDLAVGACESDAGGEMQGAVWILLLNPDGTVRSEQEISATAGGFGGDLDPVDLFGTSVASPGDLDGDGRPELAVGARWDDDGARDKGAVWILFLNADGTVRSEQKISATAGGFGGDLRRWESFGTSCTALGDLDQDGIGDLAVGAPQDFQLSIGTGALWLLFMDRDGTVLAEQKISGITGGFAPANYLYDFGASVAPLGDLDGDGVLDLAVGAPPSFGEGHGAVWTLLLGACVRLDFETEDDFVTPLSNGQHLDTEFGRLATLSSTGPNAGLGLFDSTVGGPNDPSQDRDLLVGTGNVLILQTENYPPDANDVFPRPNDDEDGGAITFSFALPVEPASLRLIDQDAGDGTATLVLTDSFARERVYTIPSNWTGDRLASQPGQGVLDLTTLSPQPGFGSTATASEAFGFDPESVIRLQLQLLGSGGLDDLVFSPAGMTRASATTRNGSGVNPEVLHTSSRPVLGRTWNAELDCSAYGGGIAMLVMRSLPSSGSMTAFGERLVAGPLLYIHTRAYSAAAAPFALALPGDLSLLGMEVHLQGTCRGFPAAPHTKVQRVHIALSNALELRLGL